MAIKQTLIPGGIAAILCTATLGLSLPAHASETGAFVGGMLTSRVMNNMHRRTQAEEQQAYYAQQQAQQQQVQQAAPAPAAAAPAQSTQQKLDQLDKLAAGGYITPEEYKAKRQAIIDAM